MRRSTQRWLCGPRKVQQAEAIHEPQPARIAAPITRCRPLGSWRRSGLPAACAGQRAPRAKRPDSGSAGHWKAEAPADLQGEQVGNFCSLIRCPESYRSWVALSNDLHISRGACGLRCVEKLQHRVCDLARVRKEDVVPGARNDDDTSAWYLTPELAAEPRV